MTTARTAPYRHSDGSGCWTKNCSRGHLSESQLLQANNRIKRFFDPDISEVKTFMTSLPTSKDSSRIDDLLAKIGSKPNALSILTTPASSSTSVTAEVIAEPESSEPDLSYQTGHQPNESGSFAYDLSDSGNFVPADIYIHPEYFFDMKENYAQESMAALRAIKGKPDALVTIYRAVPKSAESINQGDWITLSRSYAHQHGGGNLGEDSKDGNWKVLEKQVPAKEIRWSGDSFNEFGWFPNNVDGPVGL